MLCVIQLQRASVSVTSNIAEGVNRYSVKDKIHFIEIAYGSLMEVSSQFEIAEELGYITPEERLSIDKLIEEVARLLSGLRSSFQPSQLYSSFGNLLVNMVSISSRTSKAGE